MLIQSLARSCLSQTSRPCLRLMHASAVRHNSSGMVNIFESLASPAIRVKNITSEGINLEDGLIIPGPCVFLDGRVFLWDVPEKQWEGWSKEHFEIFDIVIPKPDLLLFGSGKAVSRLPPAFREHLNQMGIQVDVMDTRNACSSYNLLTEEGRRVAAALLPVHLHKWRRFPPQA